MLSLRIQIVGIIVAFAFLTLAIGVGTGSLLIRNGIVRVEEDCLRVVADLADALISSKLDFLKSGARTIALDVALSTDERIDEVLQKHCNTPIGTHDNTASFSALTVVERTGEGENEKFTIVASQGTLALPERLLVEKPDYLVKTFEGSFIASTTVEIRNTAGSDQKIVFFVCAPIVQSHETRINRILCATLDGMYFTEVLDKFRLWDKEGDIVLCDGEGSVIATIFQDMTTGRVNYIELAKLHPANSEFQSLANFFSQMVEGKPGRSIHTFRGHQRVGYYRPITGTATGWALGVTAPIVSSLHREAMRGIVALSLVTLVISLVVAVFASSFLVKPFKEALRAKEIAEKASKSKSVFLANMSHEMRTPLNAIIGLSELTIGSGAATGDVAGNLEKIYTSGMTLLGTVNDLLDISKIEAGKLDLVPVEYDLPSLINDTVALNSVRIGSKPIHFKIDVDENLPSRLFGDELRIKQMLNNLLSNAIKYTQAGQVTWSIAGKHEGGDFFLVFKISDTGIGIRRQDISVLFDEYYQIDSEANRKIEGTGLGLSLVKKMANLMGGTVSVASVFGKGSTFTLRIQQKPLTEEVIGKEVVFNLMHMRHSQNKLVRNSQLTRLKLPYVRVLVVDDVQTNLDVARGMLKPYEMMVDCVTSGQMAIDVMRDEGVRYNAIFMDHMMPGMDGIEAVQKIREIGTEYAQTIPIIALTANAIMGSEEMFLERGFQAFLSKPVDIMRLDGVIRRWLRDKSHETSIYLDQSSEVISSATRASWTIAGLDKERALVQFGNSEATLLVILQSFVKNTPGLLDKIRVITASQLQDHVALFHGIKGTCYGICADGVGKQAEALEHAARQANVRYFSEHHDNFIKAVEELIDRIKTVLPQ